MNKLWKKGIIFIMIFSTVSVLATTRATLYLAGFVETICNIFIVPRLNFANGLDISAGGSLDVADVVEEANLVNGYTLHAWSLNNSQLCDANQTTTIVALDEFNPTATSTGRCVAYTANYVAASTATATVTPNGAQTVGAATGSAVELSRTVPFAPGDVTGIVTGVMTIVTTAPATPVPAGLYDDTLVLEMRAL